MLYAESSCIVHDKEFLLYFTWPLTVTLLRVQGYIFSACSVVRQKLIKYWKAHINSVKQKQDLILLYYVSISLLIKLRSFDILVATLITYMKYFLSVRVYTCTSDMYIMAFRKWTKIYWSLITWTRNYYMISLSNVGRKMVNKAMVWLQD